MPKFEHPFPQWERKQKGAGQEPTHEIESRGERTRRRPLSRWEAIKVGAIGTMMLGSVFLEAGLSAKRADAAQKSKRPAAMETSKTTEQYLRQMKNFNQQYYEFDPSDKETARELYRAGEKIESSKEFKGLGYVEKAEFFHRHAYSLYRYSMGMLEDNYENIGEKQLKEIVQNVSECQKKFEQAIRTEQEVEGTISENRERSVRALIELGRSMAYEAIRLEAERPELKEQADIIKKEAADSVNRSFQFDSNPRYIDDGFILFPKQEKNRIIRTVIGLAKRKGQIPLNITEDEAAQRISSIHCDVIEEVVPWANAVATGGAKATAVEKSFIDRLVDYGVLVKKGNKYTVGKITSLIMTDPDPAVFLQVIAKKVARDNPNYLKDARREYDNLSIDDRELFDKYLEKEFPNASDRVAAAHFFAIKHQIGDWRIGVKKALGQKK